MYRNFFFMLMLLTLSGCSDDKAEKTINPVCINGQSACFVEVLGTQLHLKFNQQRLVAETPFMMRILPNDSSKISEIKAYMEGDNMYMGKIPLLFNFNRAGYYEAQGFVGSCGKTDMRWRIWLTATDSSGKAETVSITVPSYLR